MSSQRHYFFSFCPSFYLFENSLFVMPSALRIKYSRPWLSSLTLKLDSLIHPETLITEKAMRQTHYRNESTRQIFVVIVVNCITVNTFYFWQNLSQTEKGLRDRVREKQLFQLACCSTTGEKGVRRRRAWVTEKQLFRFHAEKGVKKDCETETEKSHFQSYSCLKTSKQNINFVYLSLITTPFSSA